MGYIILKSFLELENHLLLNIFHKSLGSKEFTEVNENLSYGTHEMRDVLSLTENRKRGQIVLPEELMGLADLEAYIYLANVFVTKMKISYKNIILIADSFKIKILAGSSNNLDSIPEQHARR